MNAVSDPRIGPPLSDAEASDVLRYWLALLRHQEALAARPKAQRQDAGAAALGDSVPNLQAPVPGQQYAKLDWARCARFIGTQRGQVDLEFDVEARAFFEDWLATAYRRGDDEDGHRVGCLVSFPTLLLPKGELGGLLRSPVELRWLLAEDRAFSVPSYRQRASGVYPEPPTRLRVVHGVSLEEDALPFFVDTKLLGEVLRIDTERLDGFFVRLRQKSAVRPRRMIDALSKLIKGQLADDAAELGAAPPPPPSDTNPKPDASEKSLRDLQSAVARRLAQLRSRTRVYPVALIVSAAEARATAHAQRDIAEALDRIADKSLKAAAPLSKYLRGDAAEQEAVMPGEPCLGRFNPAGLTPHQLRATELSLNARLSAIQGPPGTGKTTLILNRVADALVRKVVPLLSGYVMSDAVLLVTSTNNAAVDNVTNPLGSGLGPDRLPLALRVGSRDVTERVTSADLERCMAWLERHREPPAGEDFDSLLASFGKSHKAMLAAARASTPASPSPERLELQGFELFQAAERLRAAWAIRNRTNLLNVLELALRAARASRSLKKMLAAPGGGGAWLRRLFPAWGSTLLSLGNVFPADAGCCEQVIIDEAGQCHPGYAVSALLRAQSALVIGDVFQLEPVIGLTLDDERRILKSQRLSISASRLEPYRTHDDAAASAQALADRAVGTRPTLVDHFRCQPEIAAICERLCGYGLVTRTARTSRVDRVAALVAPVLFVPLDGEQQRHAGSWMNPLEVFEVVRWVQHLIAHGIPPEDIGVITPFRGQLDALWRELRLVGVPIEAPGDAQGQDNLDLFGATGRGLGLGTVHRFQGGERSVILFSTTVTRTASLRFVDERVNLINVAASRARDHLVTLGHEPTLRAGRHTRVLLDLARHIDLGKNTSRA